MVTSINNLIIGRIYVDHGGVMRIRNASGLVCKLRFREHSFLRAHNEHEARRLAHITVYRITIHAPYIPYPVVTHQISHLTRTLCRRDK